MAPTEPALPLEIAPEAEDQGRISSLELTDDLTASFMSRKSAGSTGRRKAGYWNVARRTLGLACLMVTVVLWTVSNFLASYIFSDHTYNKPFFVVYINTSIFAFSMIPIAVRHILRKGGYSDVRSRVSRAWRERSLAPLTSGLEHTKLPSHDDEEDQMAGERLLADDERTPEAPDTPLAGARPLDGGGGGGSESTPGDKLTVRETAWLSLEFCMLWFFANYFASACLEYTSVGSVTILTSTSSVWTLIFCAVMRIEGFTVRKLVGVLASLAGIILISSVDLSGKDNDEDRGNFPHKSQRQIAIGDAMALVSALVYGLYVTVMKQRVGSEDRVSMPLFFGFVGIFNLVLLWPVFFLLHFTGVETFEMPPSGKVWAIIIMNSLASFVSDMSWAYAMLLTTPLIVTVGLSLTIPLSLIGEMIQYQQFSSFLYWVGAVIVLMSFLFINHESKDDDDGETRAGAEGGARPVATA